MPIFTQDEIDDLSKTLQRQAVFEYARDIILNTRIERSQSCPCCKEGSISTAGVYEIIPNSNEMRFMPIQEALSSLTGLLHAYLDGAYLRLSFKSRQLIWMVRPSYSGKKWERNPDGTLRPPSEWIEKYAFPGEFGA